MRRDRKVVAIGGGTGLSTLVRGLKHYPLDITAIVTVGDDGGSSGRLRDEFHMLPPGDIRNVILALSEVVRHSSFSCCWPCQVRSHLWWLLTQAE